jgi:hypothetical protein
MPPPPPPLDIFGNPIITDSISTPSSPPTKTHLLNAATIHIIATLFSTPPLSASALVAIENLNHHLVDPKEKVHILPLLSLLWFMVVHYRPSFLSSLLWHHSLSLLSSTAIVTDVVIVVISYLSSASSVIVSTFLVTIVESIAAVDNPSFHLRQFTTVI